MPNEKHPLQSDQISEVSGGLFQPPARQDANEYKSYTDPDYPVHCPKCNSNNIWYVPAIFGIAELERYWCRNCNHEFDYDQLTDYGASCDW